MHTAVAQCLPVSVPQRICLNCQWPALVTLTVIPHTSYATLSWLLTLSCAGVVQVYSFGVTVWQIMERKRPFEGLEPYQVGPACYVK